MELVSSSKVITTLPLSVERDNGDEISLDTDKRILIVGPTGSGKSSVSSEVLFSDEEPWLIKAAVIESLTGRAVSLTIVTTMWNRLYNERMVRRAEQHFQELATGVWKPCVDQGARIVKFQNTHKSALEIVQDALSGASSVFDGMTDGPHTLLLYQDLFDRIEDARQRKGTTVGVGRKAEASSVSLLVRLRRGGAGAAMGT
ncbi:hypothetical protein BJ165DRAFT_1529797 [Panaeolus papilionaceus]|nr:hypothetical protein BJ165DRAFT_1529797 [Panaeolus papilionaceus]